MSLPPIDSRFGPHNADCAAIVQPCARNPKSLEYKGKLRTATPPPGSLPPGREGAAYPSKHGLSTVSAHKLHESPSGDCAVYAPQLHNLHNDALCMHNEDCAEQAKPVDRIVSNGATTRSDQVKAALASDPTLAWLPARLRKTFGPGVRLTYLETPAYRDGTPPAIPNSDLFTEYRT